MTDRVNDTELEALIQKHMRLVAGVEENSRTLEALLDLRELRGRHREIKINYAVIQQDCQDLKRELQNAVQNLRDILAKLNGQPLLQ